MPHIVGQPLGALYHIPHGDACAIFLVPSMKANMLHSLQKYVNIARVLGVNVQGMSEAAEIFDLAHAIETIRGAMGHIKNNPRPTGPEVFKEMIRGVL